MTTVAGIHQGADTHANRPAANTVTAGTLYSCSDHDLIYISDGSTWSTYATVGGGGASPLTTKGDVYVYGTADARLPLGTDGHVLTADSAQTLGVKWAAAAGGGSTVPEWMETLAAPASAHGDDQEFTGTIGGTAVTPSGTATWTQDQGLLSVKFDSQNANDMAARMYPLTPTSPPVTLTTRMRLLTKRSDNPMFGVVFSDGTSNSSNVTAFFLFVTVGSVKTWASTTGTFENFSTTTRLSDALGEMWNPATWIYVRFVWTAANTWGWALSLDGVSYTDFGEGTFAGTLTPTHFGAMVTSWGQTFPSVATFEFLRIAESDLSV